MIELSSEQLVVAHDFGLYAKKKYQVVFFEADVWEHLQNHSLMPD